MRSTDLLETLPLGSYGTKVNGPSAEPPSSIWTSPCFTTAGRLRAEPSAWIQKGRETLVTRTRAALSPDLHKCKQSPMTNQKCHRMVLGASQPLQRSVALTESLVADQGCASFHPALSKVSALSPLLQVRKLRGKAQH